MFYELNTYYCIFRSNYTRGPMKFSTTASGTVATLLVPGFPALYSAWLPCLSMCLVSLPHTLPGFPWLPLFRLFSRIFLSSHFHCYFCPLLLLLLFHSRCAFVYLIRFSPALEFWTSNANYSCKMKTLITFSALSHVFTFPTFSTFPTLLTSFDKCHFIRSLLQPKTWERGSSRGGGWNWHTLAWTGGTISCWADSLPASLHSEAPLGVA